MIEKIIIQPDKGPWLNAHLTPGLDVRVGIPSSSGKLAFHAFQNEYKTMVSAQAFWNARAEKFRVPSASDLFETDFALDSAGYAWANELAKSCSESVIRNLIKPPVPVVQGWRSDQYQRSLDLTLEVWERWQPWLAPPALIGVGSVCRREIGHPTHGLFAIGRRGAKYSAWFAPAPVRSKGHRDRRAENARCGRVHRFHGLRLVGQAQSV